MNPIRNMLFNQNGKVYFMNIDSATYPGRLFKGLMIRLTILTVEKNTALTNQVFSTNYKRFFQHERKHLFSDVKYAAVNKDYIKDGLLPKIGSEFERRIMEKLVSKTKKNIGNFIDKPNNDEKIYFRNTGAVYYCMAFDKPPYYSVNGLPKISSTLSEIRIKKEFKYECVYP
jgi:hypothetical protein